MSAHAIAPLPARTAVGKLAVAAVTAASASAARAAGAARFPVDPARVAIAYTSERHFAIDGFTPEPFAPLSGFFPAADGWVRTHGNYPHHADALRQALDLDPDAGRDAAAAALASLTAAEASDRVTSLGGLCVAVRREDPHEDERLRATPLVRTSSLGASRPVPRTAGDPGAPLRGIRVLDLTRVIAGPVCTRTLALLGADVLRIDPPGMPEIAAQHLDTGHGKRSTLLDLRAHGDREVFDSLLANADVVVLGYRPDGLDRLGLSPAALAERRPGLVVARLSAWGEPGRRGFDSLVQAATGIAWIESPDGVRPGALPAQALDHSAGYVLAAAVIDAVVRRGEEGGSWLVETSLRRIAAELLGMPRTADPTPLEIIDPAPHLQTFDVDGVAVTTAAPAIAYVGAPAAYAAAQPWGRDEPAWVE